MVCTNVKQSSSRFTLGKATRRIVRKKSHRTGYTLVHGSPRSLVVSWSALANLGQSWLVALLWKNTVINRSNGTTVFTCRKAGTQTEGSSRGKWIVRCRIYSGCNPDRECPFSLRFPSCIHIGYFYKGNLKSGNAMIK